jgi:hypothetical protein
MKEIAGGKEGMVPLLTLPASNSRIILTGRMTPKLNYDEISAPTGADWRTCRNLHTALSLFLDQPKGAAIS